MADADRGIHVLVVDDEANVQRTLAICLQTAGHAVTSASSITEALSVVDRSGPFELAFVDVRLGTANGLDLIPQLQAISPWTRIVVITAHGTIETAVEAMKRGAVDFLPKPFTPAQVELVARRVADLNAPANASDDSTISLDSTNPAVQKAVAMARQVAGSDAAVLIRGESGTGKGVLTRAIHHWSNRAKEPFATISCPAMSPQLLESELFGHVRGAFTGAVRDHPGRIETAAGGTLFLDEIGDLPLPLQPKLLRFLQDREYEPVGGTKTLRADVRIITATNVDLEEAVKTGKFREDLLYRVNVMQIVLPPLRQRAEDVVPLAQRMLAFFSRGRRVVGFTPEALQCLQSYAWPGNLRELRNVVERAVILCTGERVGAEHLPEELSRSKRNEVRLGDPVPFEKIEEAHLRGVLRRARSMEEAAAVLGVDPTTLWRKRRKYNI